MTVSTLLERLQRVSRHGSDRWRAICPAHESRHRTQSLAVRELSDGRVLLKCFAGCGSADVLAAVGLTYSELFPPAHSAAHEGRPAQRTNHWHAIREAVETLQHECLLVAIAAGDMARGEPLSHTDAERVGRAAERVRDALRACI